MQGNGVGQRSHRETRAYCPHCVHFAITWDRQAPYGCRAWGVRTAQHPSRSVLAASGIPCQYFRKKPTK
ncbi:hypothetical protein SAMN02746041_00670 [Desulfacinum hydrothermale DSM 13146]|uniref:Uracil-DNA glycosylase n=1 Tax=Desulfacinum hydrothermale DSM 13146 TaxID=1121390 RepID=A0A1W1X667_9BACT|nr:hypothetical protein [Desulfacinum hydrothermale]SMC19422.1 hypothetical protein SAMN02746041_00670 [Desulfacinum hydrothermale DSM 13146]